MKAFPKEEILLKGSPAAKKLAFQFRKQLPLSDFLMEANSGGIKTSNEIVAFEKFTKDRNKNACAVGHVEILDEAKVSKDYLLN